MGDKTIIQGVTESLRRDRLPPDVSEDRRHNPTDWLKWLPLVVAVMGGYGGYVRLQSQVERANERHDALMTTVQRMQEKADETHAALWRKVTE